MNRAHLTGFMGTTGMTLLAPNLSEIRPFLAVGVLFALLLWETLSPFFTFPMGRARLGHGIRNVVLGAMNAAITALAFVGLWLLAASWAERNGFGLLHWVSWPPWIEWLLAIVLLDAWTYAWHRMNHRIPFLWRFHRVHHSDPHMDVTTANRFHTGEIVISSLLRVPLIALLGASIGQLALYEILMFAVVQFHHANIGISEKWDRALRLIIVTPCMHKVHHSRWQPETDSNYSSLLSIWDRIFQSFKLRREPKEIRIGLDDFDIPEFQSIRGLIKTPLAPNRPKRPAPDHH